MQPTTIAIALLALPLLTKGAEPTLYEDSFSTTLGGVDATVTAKRTLRGAAPDAHSVRNLFDGRPETAWCTRGTGGSGSDSAIDAPLGAIRIRFARPAHLKALVIRNGYQKSPAIFRANRRAAGLTLEKVITPTQSLPLTHSVRVPDGQAPQELSLRKGWTPTVNLFGALELIVGIDEPHEGTRYPDLCLSELSVKVTPASGYQPARTWQDLAGELDSARGALSGKLLDDLIFYALEGNPDALARVRSMRPDGAAASAAMEMLFRPAIEAARGTPGR